MTDKDDTINDLVVLCLPPDLAELVFTAIENGDIRHVEYRGDNIIHD